MRTVRDRSKAPFVLMSLVICPHRISALRTITTRSHFECAQASRRVGLSSKTLGAIQSQFTVSLKRYPETKQNSVLVFLPSFSSQHVDLEHPPDKEHCDDCPCDMNYPVADCLRSAEVEHDGIVARGLTDLVAVSLKRYPDTRQEKSPRIRGLSD